jgi:hypothetical protein
MKQGDRTRLPEDNAGVSEVESVLRQIAQAPAPEGLEDRIKAALQAAPQAGKVLPWRSMPAASRSGTLQGILRGAAAAAIVLVVSGGSWGIYSRVQPARTVGPGLPHGSAPGGFSSAGAMRTPQTLVVPQVHGATDGSSGQTEAAPIAGQPPSKGRRAYGTKGAKRPATQAGEQ